MTARRGSRIFVCSFSGAIGDMKRKDQRDRLKVLATGRMNSALVEFEDGHKVITSRYAVRKLPANAPHEGPGAASSRTVQLDAVVGGQESALTGRR